jgi:iron complex transport system permease protein
VSGVALAPWRRKGLPEVRFSGGRATAILLLLAACTALALLASCVLGEYPVGLKRALFEPASVDATVFWRLRVPRALLGALVGAALGASGSALQALLRNPLADPFILGVSGGAALGATVALAVGLTAVLGPSLFAFLGSLLAMGLVLLVGRSRRSPYAALLTGVVFNAFAAAAITCIKTLVSPDRVGEILYWLAGSLGYEPPRTLAAAAVLQLFCVGMLWRQSGRLNLLSLGDEDAASLGVRVDRTRALVLVAASLSVAGAVALSGLVGFVGLIVPHLLRLLVGPDQRLLVPASALGGAAFLVLSDLLTRLLFPVFRAELPVGVVTAVLGGPLFLYLLQKREVAA